MIELERYDSPLEPTLEAERVLLGCMMLSTVPVRWFRTHGSVEWFCTPGHKAIANAILKAAERGASLGAGSDGPDLVVVQSVLGAQLQEVGGMEYLCQCFERVFSFENMWFYAEVVKDKWVKRVLDERIKALKQHAPDALAQELLAQADELTKGLHGQFYRDLEQAGEVDLDDSEVDGLSTGFKCIDKLCTYRGFPVGLNVILAGTNVGKTRLAIQMMGHHVDPFSSHRAVFVSLEMNTMQVIQAHVHQQTGMSRYPKKPKPTLLAEENDKAMREYEADVRTYNNAADMIRKSGLHIWSPDMADRTVENICSKLEEAHMKNPINSIWVDYIQLIGCNSPKDHSYNKTLIMEHVAATLKAFAMRIGCPIIVLAQPADKTVKSPFDLEVMHSRTIENACEMMIAMTRDKATNESAVCTKKNRYGFVAMVDGMSFDPKYAKWVEA